MPVYATLVQFKESLPILAGSPTESPDAYLTAVLDRADSLIDSIIGRPVNTMARTEFVSGDNTSFLTMKNGPISMLTSLNEISYDSDGAETAVLVPRGNFRLWGEVGDNWLLPSHLEADGWNFTKGVRNYKIIANSGWNMASARQAQIIVQACLFAATWFFNKRKDAATTDRVIGSGSLGPFRDEFELVEELRVLLSAFIPVRH